MADNPRRKGYKPYSYFAVTVLRKRAGDSGSAASDAKVQCAAAHVELHREWGRNGWVAARSLFELGPSLGEVPTPHNRSADYT